MSLEALRSAIRDVPDFPKEGILFKDITTVLSDAALFREAVDIFVDRHADSRIDAVAAIEARGFVFGSAAAYKLGCGIIPIRKKGKLPYKTVEKSYDLEYGSATLEMHVDAVSKGMRVLLMDDLLATGGTAAASAEMLDEQGAEIVEIDFLIELGFLNGREKLGGRPVYSPIVY